MSRKTHINSLFHNDENGATPQWMLTFADLLSLILTFFVLLYAMREPESPQWRDITASLSQRLRPTIRDEYIPPASEESIPRVNAVEAADLTYLLSILKDKLKDAGALRDRFTVKLTPDRLILTFREGALFVEESSHLTDEGVASLKDLGNVLESIGNHIDVYGYNKQADDKTLSDLWLNSLGRAGEIARHLNENGYPYKITLYGRASAQDPFEVQNTNAQAHIIIRKFPAEY